MTIKFEALSPEDANWFGVEVMLRAPDSTHFPTAAIAGVVAGKYTDTFGIGYKVRGVMGSGSVGVSRVGAERAAELLRDAGHRAVQKCLWCDGRGEIYNSYDYRACDLCGGEKVSDFYGYPTS